MSIRNVILLCLASAALALFVALVGPKLLNRASKQRFVTVDLSGLIARQQEQAVKQIAAGDGDESKRKAALAAAEAFGKRVNAEAHALSRECGCILLMREAVVAGEVEDLTAVLAARISTP